MAFFILMKGNLVSYEFDYLSGENRDCKWEKTKPNTQSMNDYLKNNEDRRKSSKELYAWELMSSPVYTLDVNAKLVQAKELMEKHNIHHIPITREGKPAGIISDRDLARLERTGTFSYLCVEEVMSSLVVCTSSASSLGEVADVFVNEKINAMPVVDEDLQVTGMISSRDILKAVVNHRFLRR